MRIVAIVQARVGSTRLPAKVLRPLGGEPMVIRVVERARRTPGIDDVVVAIPDDPEDDVLERSLVAHDVSVVRGPNLDVLHRYELAARASGADVVVRITADCPFVSPQVCGLVVDAFLATVPPPDYVSNTMERTFPRGLDVEVIGREALLRADREASAPWQREHVTPYIWQHPDRFSLRSVRAAEDNSTIRLTVDTPEDLSLAEAIYERLANEPSFDLDVVLELLKREPELLELNRAVVQKDLIA